MTHGQLVTRFVVGFALGLVMTDANGQVSGLFIFAAVGWITAIDVVFRARRASEGGGG
jgi:hypothetical protein